MTSAMQDYATSTHWQVIAAKRYAGDDDEFGLWIALVDRYIFRACGFSLHDLEDMPYRDWYDSGLSPSEAGYQALEEMG